MSLPTHFSLFFFFNDTATTEIYTLSLHDALPIYAAARAGGGRRRGHVLDGDRCRGGGGGRQEEEAGAPQAAPQAGSDRRRSEEHTSELQSQSNLVCRLLLEKKKNVHIKLHLQTHV